MGLFLLVCDIDFDKFKNNVFVLVVVVKYFNFFIILIISFEEGLNGFLVFELVEMFFDVFYIVCLG